MIIGLCNVFTCLITYLLAQLHVIRYVVMQTTKCEVDYCTVL